MPCAPGCAKHHKTATELLLRCYKTHAADQGVTYAQALDEALCFGWIDGIRRRVDDDCFSVRFLPRTPRSIWSRVNVGHVQRLIEAGWMMKPGLAAFEARGGTSHRRLLVQALGGRARQPDRCGHWGLGEDLNSQGLCP